MNSEPVGFQQNNQMKALPQIFTGLPNIQPTPTSKQILPQRFALPNPQLQLQPQLQFQPQLQPQLQQQMQSQPLLQPQPFMYQGVVPMGGMPPGGNFIVVPYLIPQPQFMNSMRPPDMLPMNAPQFIQLSQGNLQMMNQQSMMQNQMMNNQFFVPFQPNNADARGSMQNLSANYNTINNNVYNNINSMGSLQNLPPFGNLTGISNLPLTPNILTLNVDSNFNRPQEGPLSVGKGSQNGIYAGSFEEGSRDAKNF